MTVENRYRTVDIPVSGGELRVGIWEPAGDPDASELPTVMAVHGVTATHRCWLTVAERLRGVRLIAPDLRGRGRSRELPGPYGMARHADDIVATMDALGVDSATLVGHSMGGFVTVATHHHHPDRVDSLILVDGGLPLPTPAGVSDEDLMTARLGPAKARLSMTFPDRESYRQFFRAHPAFADDWNDTVTDYVDYDLVGEPPNLRSSTVFAAMAEDSVDLQSGSGWLLGALKNLPSGTAFLRAEGGMLGAQPGLYEPDWTADWQRQLPSVVVRDVLGVNHYTILFSEIGAAAVMRAVNDAVRERR